MFDQEPDSPLNECIQQYEKLKKENDQLREIAQSCRDALGWLYGSANVKWQEWTDSDYWSATNYQLAQENARKALTKANESGLLESRLLKLGLETYLVEGAE